jgi:hypothetical protein
LIALFIMLVSTVLTQVLHAAHLHRVYQAIFLMNALLLISGITLFAFTDNAFYTVGGMVLSLGILVVTVTKYTDF